MGHKSFPNTLKRVNLMLIYLTCLSIILIASQSQISVDIYAQSSANYRLLKQTIGVVAQRGDSTGYRLNGTLGQPSATSRMTSASYHLSWGYWQELSISNRRIYLPIVLK